MKNPTVNFKQYSMSYNKCLINVVKCLSNLHVIEDNSRNFAIRINEADEQIEKIYSNIATKSKENNSPKTKKAS